MLGVFFVSTIEVTKDIFDLVWLKMIRSNHCLLQIQGKMLEICVEHYDAMHTTPVPLDLENNDYKLSKTGIIYFNLSFCEKDDFRYVEEEFTVEIYKNYVLRFDRLLKITDDWPNILLTGTNGYYEVFRSDNIWDPNYKELTEVMRRIETIFNNKDKNNSLTKQIKGKKSSKLRFIFFLILVFISLLVICVVILIYYYKSK